MLRLAARILLRKWLWIIERRNTIITFNFIGPKLALGGWISSFLRTRNSIFLSYVTIGRMDSCMAYEERMGSMDLHGRSGMGGTILQHGASDTAWRFAPSFVLAYDRIWVLLRLASFFHVRHPSCSSLDDGLSEKGKEASKRTGVFFIQRQISREGNKQMSCRTFLYVSETRGVGSLCQRLFMVGKK